MFLEIASLYLSSFYPPEVNVLFNLNETNLILQFWWDKYFCLFNILLVEVGENIAVWLLIC